nr:asparagine synthetase domain-containing protein CG17486 isoform X3 [Danaus plexippus plexippus]
MCGIFCEIYFSKRNISKDEKLLNCIKRRGPDCMNELDIEINKNFRLFMCGCVLWMQGKKPIKQPLESDTGILLFNGDIFNSTWGEDSDTEALLNIFDNAMSTDHLRAQLKALKGPFSLIYYNKHTKIMYFVRDRIGRNSLLFHKSENSYVLSNILSRKYLCSEIPASHIYEMDINKKSINLHSWETCENSQTISLDDWIQSCQDRQSLPDEDFCFDYESSLDLNEKDSVITHIENASLNHKNKQHIFESLLDNEVILNTVKNICKLLGRSVQVRVQTQPNKCKSCISNEETYCEHCTTGILFSGGLDCTILAFLADKFLPKKQPIDLINVAFKSKDSTSYDVPDRITGRQSYQELQRLCPDRLWVFHEVNVPKEQLEEYQSLIIGDLVYPRKTILDESLGSALWFAAGAGSLSHYFTAWFWS